MKAFAHGRKRALSLLAALAFAEGWIAPANAAKLYWPEYYSAGIYRSNPDGSNRELLFRFPDRSLATGAVAIDLAGGKLYFATYNFISARPGEGIYRMNLDGTAVEQIVSDVNGATSIALDLVSGRVYWQDPVAHTIRRANFDGSNVEEVIAVTGGNVAIDSAAGKLYWIDGNPRGLRRANLDGTGVEDLPVPVNGHYDFDFQANQVYWMDDPNDAIRRANLDGSNVEILVAGYQRRENGFALDLDRRKMYWADSVFQMYRADLDGSNVQRIIDTGPYVAFDPWDVAVAVFGSCGDGLLDTFEECDDGNNLSGDGCQADCLIPRCADGILDAGEQCDDGNLAICDGCSDQCVIEPGFVCGDGVLNGICGEECDDGNLANGDGCQGDCQLPICGDSIVDDGEECDDGDALDEDECTNQCMLTDPSILYYDQTDQSIGIGVFDQGSGESEDSEAADDFVITDPAGWTVSGVLTLGESIGWAPDSVSITIYADDAGRPGSPVCQYPELTSYVEEGGDLVITFPSPCVLGPGRWWLGQQVSLSSYFGYHYWTIRMIQNYHEAVWRNPGDFFGTGCVDWTPQTVCGWEGPDLLFQIRREAPDPVPAATPWGTRFLMLVIGTLSVFVLRRRH